jgi:hypothetical protein
LPFGFVADICPVARDSSHHRTVRNAIEQRIGVDLGVPDPELVARLRGFVRRWCGANLQPLARSHLMDFYEWIAQTPYSVSRKSELTAIYEELHGRLPTPKQSCRVNCFIKTESYPFEEYICKHGRLIMSRSDWAKVIMGPAFSSIEKVVYDVRSPRGELYFLKHVPVSERYKYVAGLRDGMSKYIITDYTSFEASFSKPIMDAVECELYRYMLSEFPELSGWICKTLTGTNVLKLRNGLSVRVKARRMSGDMCTSLGNGFTNLMLMLFCAEELKFKCEGFVEGDDGLFRLDRIDQKVSWFLRALGFVIKLQAVEDPSLGGFCGIVAGPSGNLKDPVRFLQTFGWTHSCVTARDAVMWQLLRAKALSAQYELPQCPILRVVADRALELTAGVEPRFEYDGYHLPPPSTPAPPFAPDVDTRQLFARLFGVSVELQLELEQQIKVAINLDFLTDCIPHSSSYSWYNSRFVVP